MKNFHRLLRPYFYLTRASSSDCQNGKQRNDGHCQYSVRLQPRYYICRLLFNNSIRYCFRNFLIIKHSILLLIGDCNFGSLSDINQDELIMQRCREIEKEVRTSLFVDMIRFRMSVKRVSHISFYFRFAIQPAWSAIRKIWVFWKLNISATKYTKLKWRICYKIIDISVEHVQMVTASIALSRTRFSNVCYTILPNTRGLDQPVLN